MRGIQRLVNATSTLMQNADTVADEAAAELEAAYAEQVEVATGYKAYAAEVAAKTRDARAQLNQLTNLAPTTQG
jgi:gamma-glutamyl:cysteine ligase YbdK (ATP-grasp superfamily)